MLEPTALDLDEIATALADQSDYDRRVLINTTSGELVFWTRDTGIDGHHPVDLDDLGVLRGRWCGLTLVAA